MENEADETEFGFVKIVDMRPGATPEMDLFKTGWRKRPGMKRRQYSLEPRSNFVSEKAQEAIRNFEREQQMRRLALENQIEIQREIQEEIVEPQMDQAPQNGNANGEIVEPQMDQAPRIDQNPPISFEDAKVMFGQPLKQETWQQLTQLSSIEFEAICTLVSMENP